MPKTRSQGAASPGQEPQSAPPRTRARKPKAVKPKIVLSPVANSSSSTQVETALPAAAARSPIPKFKDVLSAVASAHITRISKASTTKASYQQPLYSRGLRSTRSTTSKLLRLSQKTEAPIRDHSPSPEMNDPPCCLHCHRNPFDLRGVPLVAPKIVYAKTNYKNASTKSSADGQEESGLTVQAAQSPFKRTREESATEVEKQPAAKRHQSNPTGSTTQSSAETTPPSVPTNTSTKVVTQMSTQTDSGNMTFGQSPSTLGPTTPKRTTMPNIFHAKSPAKSPQFSPITRSQVGSMQITSGVTWGQLQQTRKRRAQLYDRNNPASQDAEDIDERSPQHAQAPTTPPTAPQAKTGLFGSIRKALQFVPQLPASVTQMVTNPFSPKRSTPVLEAKQTDSSPVQEPTNGMEDSKFAPPNMPESSPTIQVNRDDSTELASPPHEANANPAYARRKASVSPSREANAHPASARHQASVSPPHEANANPASTRRKASFSPPHEANANPASARRTASVVPPHEVNANPASAKRKAFGLYYDDPTFSPSDESDNEFSPPAAKRQKLEKAQTPRSVLKKRTGNRNNTVPRTNKRVTFDDSPVDTPSKVRTRAHEYNGIHFADAQSQSSTNPSSDDDTNLSNSPATKANTETNTPFYYDPPEIPPLPVDYVMPAGFTPTSANPQPGTFCLDFNTYDENDDDIDWDAPIDAIHSNIVSEGSDTPTNVRETKATHEEPVATPAMALPPATPRIAHAELPSTTVAPGAIDIHTDINAEAPSTTTQAETNVLADVTQQINVMSQQLNKIRSTVEQHKSKSPSRLSQVDNAASSSPPAEDEYDEFDAGWPKPKSYVEAGICSQRVFDIVNKKAEPSPPAEDDYNEFDAGWPKPKTYVEAGICSQRIFDIVNKNSDPRDLVIGEMIYEQDLKEWEHAHALQKERGIPVKYLWVEDEEEVEEEEL